MYKEYPPCSLLSPYIDKYWEFEGQPEYGMKINILPDGCTDFIFALGEVADAIDSSLVMQPYRSYFVGPMTGYSELVTYANTVHMLGIRFHPCGIFRFLQLPLHELTNQRICSNELDCFFNNSLVDKLCEKTNIHERINLIEELLINHLYHYDSRAEREIVFAVNHINHNKGQIPISTLANETNLCQRHFERKFKKFTGYTPKEYSRIIQFRNAVNLLRTNTVNDLLSIAIKSGYYDVPHLSREIKRMSGNTPASFFLIPQSEEVTLTYLKNKSRFYTMI